MKKFKKMPTQNSFVIYNASAGSGKTYTLVKEYLKILFKSNSPLAFKNILALTFTNKAVGEMKERIVDTLQQFSEPEILSKPNSIFKDITEELNLTDEAIHKKSKRILQYLIHNYASFDVSTIDKFNHRLIRTFAYDLKLSVNFEVELDQDELLNEAVDSLINKAGTDNELTKILIDFAIEKTDDDKSWDIAFDFNKISKLLINENDLKYIETLKDKTLLDFETLKKQLIVRIKACEKSIVKKSKEVLALIEECGLQFDDFSRSSVPKHFVNLTNKKFDIKFNLNWQTDLIEQNALYPKRVTPAIASIIDEIQPQLASVFNETKQAVFQLKFLKAFYKNCTPLSVLNAISKELKDLKEEQNKLMISEFNSIICNEIKDQPTPYIYERLGEKYRHYFIDEFQDTSTLQWENLKPLISNALEQEVNENYGSLMLVGDAKQAIYRWRGGKAEQFIKLFNKNDNPFFIEQDVHNLPVNYRSFKTIVDFNNNFFKFLSENVFSISDYQKLYNSSSQKHNQKLEGFVNLSFLDIQREDNKDEIYTDKVYETIKNCLKKGYNLSDICVLVRKKREGLAISDYLTEQQINIISSETMLLQKSKEIAFINSVLSLLVQPNNSETKIVVLNYLASKNNINNKHQFFKAHLPLSLKELFRKFEELNIYIDADQLQLLPLYDLVETIIRSFNLVKTSNAYVQFYLDVVLEYSQKQGSDILNFLHYFEKKKDSLSIISPQGQNAVQIMTIHKSKGLEFPIVIFPYADLDIYREKEPKEWFPINSENYNGFSHTLLNYNKDFENFNDVGKQIYNKHQSELELDNINILYVAITRAVEQLYVISKKDIDKKGIANSKTYSGFLINYLQHENKWNESEESYSFGNYERESSTEEGNIQSKTQKEFISTSKQDLNITIITNSGYLWDTSQQKAIEKGNLIHGLMSLIKTTSDVDFALQNYISSGKIDTTQAGKLKQLLNEIIEHQDLKPYFTSEYEIYNERDIITTSGIILRPDRLLISKQNEAIIIDYKTGLHNPKYTEQLQDYRDVLESMNLKVIKKILIYINDTITIKEL